MHTEAEFHLSIFKNLGVCLKNESPSINSLVSNEMGSSSRASNPANDSGSDSDLDIYMPSPSSHFEVEQLSTMTEEYNYPTVSEGSGKRNNDDANIYVDSDACDSPIGLTSQSPRNRHCNHEHGKSNLMQYYLCNHLNPTEGRWFKRRGSLYVASSFMPGFVERLTEGRPKRKIVVESVPLQRDGRPGLRYGAGMQQTGCETQWAVAEKGPS